MMRIKGKCMRTINALAIMVLLFISTASVMAPDCVIYAKNTEGENSTNSTTQSESSPSPSSNEDTSPLPEDVSNPKLIVSKWDYGKKSVEAGKQFTIRVTLKNTDRKKAIKNVTASMDCDKEGMEHSDSLGNKYVNKVGAGSEVTVSFPFRAKKDLESGQYKFTINMEYESGDTGSTSSSANGYVNVKQKLKIKVESITDFTEVEDGDQIPLTVQIMNLSRTNIYNVRCYVKGKEINSTETQFLGEMAGGSSNNCELQLDMDRQSGNANDMSVCNVDVKYEDESGKTYTSKSELYFKINPIVADKTVEKDNSPVHWWITLIIIIGVAVLALTIWRLLLHRRRKMEA